MKIRFSRWLASIAFLLLVPLAIWLAYAGTDYGLYPPILVPVAVGGVLVVGLAGLFVVLPLLRRWERSGESDG